MTDPGTPPERFANAFRLMRNGDRVVAEFGTAQAQGGPHEPARIIVAQRVDFSLDAARRLLIWLEDSLTPHLASLRREEAKRLSPEEAAVAMAPGRGLIADGTRPTSGHDASKLVSLVEGLGRKVLSEQSFRMRDRSLQTNRFLLGLDIGADDGDFLPRLLSVCDALAIPARLRERVAAGFPTATSVHFGFEDHADGPVWKVYLERRPTPAEIAAARGAGETWLLHRAVKWNPVTGMAVAGFYHLFPGLGAAEIAARVDDIMARVGGEALGAVRAVLDRAVVRVPAEELQYLEVEEEGMPRKSFDINLYPARLAVRAVQPELWRMASETQVPGGRLQLLYDEIKNRPLGHLAGGIHRDGRPFFNVYYATAGARPAGSA